MEDIIEPIYIVGISIITSNEAAQSQQSIAKLWDEFSKTPIQEKIENIASTSVFAVYSDYENGFKGKYKITIGFSVKEPKNIPDGLTSVTIPAGHYKSYHVKSYTPQEIIAVWKKIWATDPKLLARNFVADFEEYKEGQVLIKIGCAKAD